MSALIFVKLALQPDSNPTLQDLRYGLMYHTVCSITPPAFAGYSSYLPTEAWLRLNRSG